MTKLYSATVIPNCFKLICITLILVTVLSSFNVTGQVATYTQEVFPTSIPNSGNVNRRVTTTDWLQSKITGNIGAPNDFEWLNWGTNPVASNQNIAGFPAGAGFVRYINRTAAYPAVSGASVGDAAFLASRSLDFSGHTIYNSVTDTFGISVFRDATAGTLLTVLDYIEVYINTQPDTSGATLLAEKVSGSTKIYRSATQLPAGAVANSFNRYQYVIPDLPAYRNATGGTSAAYIIIAAYSAGGNNIYIDNFNFPQWTTAMTIQNAVMISQQSLDVGKSVPGNEIACIKITVKGSAAPLKVDVASFTPAGSTNFAIDVTASYCYYTGASSLFGILGNAIQMPQLPINTGPLGNGYLAYGWGSGTCTAGLAPAAMTLNPGTENYLWLTYNIAPNATSNNFVGCDFECVTSKNGTCNNYGLTGFNDISPQTLNAHRKIEAGTYYYAPYGQGCLCPYNPKISDLITAVNMPGDNGTVLNNYDHDDTCTICMNYCTAFGIPPAYCNRRNCWVNYTNFTPVNVSTFKNRFVQVSAGRGKRDGSSPYVLKSQASYWPNNNNIGVFIDWNSDGDFDDTYNGAGGLITESYGTHAMLNGDLNSYPVTTWPANTTWLIDVPAVSGEIVTDLGTQACSECTRNTSQLMLGNVRMRIREVYAVSIINPFTWYWASETEDYTVQVLDNCPAPALNVCTWIGQTNDWPDPGNWCPAVPTINDMAYIPVLAGSYVYPTIKENTTAICRMLKIMDNGSGTGAQVNIDAKINGVLKVADDIIIGDGAPLSGSSAALNVNSSFNNTLTIPGKSALPPSGIALVPQTPFRTTAHAKTQIAYTASELSGTYGLKPGDIIDQLSIEVSSIAGGVAAASSYPNFQIVAYLTNAPVTFPYPVPGFTKIAIAAGDANVQPTWPRTIFSAAPLTLNMPNGAGGTQANGNYYTFNLNANTLVWDGVSNLVLSFEYKTTAGLNPPRSYVLYNEASPAFSVLSISYATAGATVTGWNIDGAGHYSAGSVAGPVAVVSNQRPRLDFKWHHPYQKATIIVGGNWINNNKGLYFTSTVQGSAGFKAGYSLVSFDPVAAMRSTVVSPGLASVNAWNPVAQPVSLGGAFSDVNQYITSNSNDAHTVFNMLEINKVSLTGSSVLQNSFTPNVMGAFADSLALTNGEFNLNRKEFTLQNSNASYLTRTNGWIRSEDNSGGVLAGNVQSKFTWKIGSGTTGTYTVPFKGAPANVFNFVYTKTAAGEDAGDLSIATYGTPAPDNVPYPKAPQTVAAMTTNPSPVVDATPWTVDRFWYLSRTTTGTLTGSIRFEYDNAEGTALANYVSNEMRAQRYEVTGWHAPYPGQSDASAPGKSWVNHPASFIDPAYNIWVVIHTNALQAPLPLSITNFDGKQVNTKVKLWWEVQSEADVVKYSVDRTVDQNFYQLIADKIPVGPSNSILNYEVWDNKPLKGIQFYRLASNNADGSVKYYGPVTINFGTQNLFEITNVVADNESLIKVDFNYDSNLPYTYMITDLLGNTVAKGDNQNAVAGENSIVIPVKLSQGIYIVSLINTDKAVSRKLVY